jgi:hypothetical protein
VRLHALHAVEPGDLARDGVDDRETRPIHERRGRHRDEQVVVVAERRLELVVDAALLGVRRVQRRVVVLDADAGGAPAERGRDHDDGDEKRAAAALDEPPEPHGVAIGPSGASWSTSASGTWKASDRMSRMLRTT